MTTYELVDAVFNFPLLVDIHLYYSYEIAIKNFEKESDAFKKLTKRSDSGIVLSEYING